jgi:hypothetical protein
MSENEAETEAARGVRDGEETAEAAEPAAETADRSSEAESAQAYADAGIMGAPGSEVTWPSVPEARDVAGADDAGEQASG